jgi:ComF family protein
VSVRGDKEAVFSSSEDRIRDGGTAAACIGPSVVQREARAGFAAVRIRRATECFSLRFSSEYRICGLALRNTSQLSGRSARLEVADNKAGSICRRTVFSSSSYGLSDDDGMYRCAFYRRTDRPFERAVAYGSDHRGLLGRMLSECLNVLEPSFSPASILVVPVPLDQRKRKQRGFSPAERIAQAALEMISAKGRLQLAPEVLWRTRKMHSQLGLTGHRRRENMRGAFSGPRAQQVTGREVLLVDDVYTTGMTVSECARVLARAGASEVRVATVARTLKLASKYQETDTVATTSEAAFDGSSSQGFKDEAESVNVENFERLKL